MGFKKRYIKPDITVVSLDKSITLMMLSNPNPEGFPAAMKGGSKITNKPFASPFGDKPFG